MSDTPTPRTDEATYFADCLGKTLVVNRACAAALETELAATQRLLHDSLIREDRFYRELAAAKKKIAYLYTEVDNLIEDNESLW
jgi:hypothetical protein